MQPFSFDIHKKISDRLGRAGTIHTPHGDIQTPSFVVVGTKATVKGITPEMLTSMGTQVVLANTYHLYLEPGDEIVKKAGGFGPMMHWDGPTMTDSGGFQVFSLGEAFGTGVSKVASKEAQTVSERKGYDRTQKQAFIDNQGVTFKSYINGDMHRLTPERSMEIQWNLGADMIFAFDECTSPHADYDYQKQAMDRTHAWAQRCIDRHEELDPQQQQALFGVVQGGRFEDLRQESARVLSGMNFDGFGIGGSFNKDDMDSTVRWVNEILPESKPRHMLGIGEPQDVFGGIEHGCDLFDCVSPTRVARHGRLYTLDGHLNIKNARYKEDFRPLEESCTCYTCTHYTRSYLHHLMRSKELLGQTLGSIHNLHFMVSLVDRIRASIYEGTFFEYKDAFLKRFYQ
jgi:queuine tRNA-ribosyltransferase